MEHSYPSEDNPPETTVEQLRRRRRELAEEIADLEEELADTTWQRQQLQRLPDWFWYPVHYAHYALTQLRPARKAEQHPSLSHWQQNADGWTLLANIAVALFVLSLLTAIAAW